MGNKLTYYICDISPENENLNTYSLKKVLPMLYIIGLEQIYKVNDSDMLFKITSKRTDYILASTEEFLNNNKTKRNLVIKENINGKNLKYLLKNYGSVGRVNDYYFFGPGIDYKIFIYDAATNTKVFDFNIGVLFKFNLFTLYNIYILEL